MIVDEQPKFRNKLDYLLIFLFLAVIFSPPIKTLLTPVASRSELENRALHPFPKPAADPVQWLAYPKQFEAFFNDHFGFREQLIVQYQHEVRARFGISGTPEVVQGRAGWLFYAAANMLEDFQGRRPLETDQLKNWFAEQDSKANWLRRRDIPYLLVIAPNKQAIYPEYLPKHVESAKGTSRLEQLLEYRSPDRRPYLLNLYPAMRTNKKSQLIYRKTDTHWNVLGAFIAFEQIINKVREWYPEENFKTDFRFVRDWKKSNNGDLGKMLLPDEGIWETNPVAEDWDRCADNLPLEVDLSLESEEQPHPPFMKGCHTANLKVVVFRDSFFRTIEPFFSENFGQVLYIWEPYSQEKMELLIASFQPDIVIEEQVERSVFP